MAHPSPTRCRFPAASRVGAGLHAGVGITLVLILFATWMLSAFFLSVDVRSPRSPYPAPTASQPWVHSPQSGARAFFRLRVPVYGGLPQSATLWVEGSQQVATYVDGFDVAPPAVAPDKLIDTQPDIPKVVQTVDIRPQLSTGLNVVGLEVVSFDGQAPAFRARVQIQNGSLTQSFGVSPSSWQSTTNVRADRSGAPAVRGLLEAQPRRRGLGARG